MSTKNDIATVATVTRHRHLPRNVWTSAMKKLALLLATGTAHAGSYVFLCRNQFFVVWTHSWPSHPPTLPHVTVEIARSDPDGEDWDGKDGRVSKRLVHFNGSDLFYRGRRCEFIPREEKR